MSGKVILSSNRPLVSGRSRLQVSKGEGGMLIMPGAQITSQKFAVKQPIPSARS